MSIQLNFTEEVTYDENNDESYQATMEAAEDAKTLKALLAAKAGKGRPATEFFAELRKKYNLPEKRPRK